MPVSTVDPDRAAIARGRRKLYLILLICVAPVVASYISYYFIHPSARSNYGELVEPQRPLPPLSLTTLDGQPFSLGDLRGKWVMLIVAPGSCDKACEDRLYQMRQVRLTTGKDRDRIERVWLISDAAPLSTMLMREYDGTHMLRANARELAAWLPASATTTDEDHIYMMDPIGNLMMRFPLNADPSKTKRDVAKLLAASSIG